MRSGIRKAIKERVPELLEVYEPTVPNKQTEKPYAVIEQLSDTSTQQGAIGSERKITIWINNDRTSFKELDVLQEQIIEAINFKSISDEKENFTCIFKGVSGSDIVNAEWDMISRALSFSVIALEKTDDYTSDRQVEAVSQYLEEILKNKNDVKINVYKDYWNQNFTIPSVLCRVVKSEKKHIVKDLYQVDKTFKIHVVDKDNDTIIHILERIENKLMADTRIYDKNKMKLTLARLIEDRDSDMFTSGQISVTFRFYGKKKRPFNPFQKIYDDKGLKIQKEE